jgi:hypothetical protein
MRTIAISLPSSIEVASNLRHSILLNDTSILAKKFRCMDRVIREVTDIELNPNNMN